MLSPDMRPACASPVSPPASMPLHLPAATAENQVIDEARRRGVGLYGMAAMRQAGSGTAEPQLVLGFGDTSQRAIQAGIAAVADLLRGH
jgi:GntR family transcriptional regulator/MocR family aminotransferase